MCLCCCADNVAGTVDFRCPCLGLPIMVSDVETRQKLALRTKDAQTFPSAFGHKSPMELRIPVHGPGQPSVIPVSREVCDSKMCVLRGSKAVHGLEILAEGEAHRGNPAGRGGGNCSPGSDHSSNLSM